MRNKLSNILWGLFFVLIGVGFAGNVLFDWNFKLFFDGWWTLIIIVPCFISIVQNGFGTWSVIGFIIGVLLLADHYVDLDFNMWNLIIPAILIFIGLRIIFNGMFHKKINYNTNYNVEGAPGSANPGAGASKSDYSAIFSGNRIRITDTFIGTNLNAVFGGLDLDLREAKFPGDVVINAQAIFGGIDIYVPVGVNVKVSNVPVFGGVSNKTGSSHNPGAPTIYLNSTCMFGGIDIK